MEEELRAQKTRDANIRRQRRQEASKLRAAAKAAKKVAEAQFKKDTAQNAKTCKKDAVKPGLRDEDTPIIDVQKITQLDRVVRELQESNEALLEANRRLRQEVLAQNASSVKIVDC